MQGESSVTQSGWTRTADPRELLPKILAKIFGKNGFGKTGFGKNLGKNSWQKKSSKNFLEQSSGKLPKMSRRHCSITACAGGYQSLWNFIQLRLRPFSTALMTLPRQAAARSDLTARGRPAATHVHQLVAAAMVDSMKPHDDVGTSPYAAGSPDNIIGSNLPDNTTGSSLLDQTTTGGPPLDDMTTGSKPHTIMTLGRNLLTTTIMPGHKVLGYDLPNGTTVCSNLHDGVIAGITLQYVTAASSSELDGSPLDGSPLNGTIASGIAVKHTPRHIAMPVSSRPTEVRGE